MQISQIWLWNWKVIIVHLALDAHKGLFSVHGPFASGAANPCVRVNECVRACVCVCEYMMIF